MSLKIKRANAVDVQFGRKLSSVPVELGLSGVEELWTELQGYVDVILGRVEPPIDSPYLALSECATQYYCRAQEMDMLIHAGERTGTIVKGSAYYKFRVGELRSFLELSKRAAELGSRRLTQEQLAFAMRETDQHQ